MSHQLPVALSDEQIEQFGGELDAIQREVKASLGESDRRYIRRMIKIQRSSVIAPKAALLLHSWKKVHVPFTILLALSGAVHIWVSWDRAW